MAEPLADRLISKIDQAADLYHRLVILAAPATARLNRPPKITKFGKRRGTFYERKP